MKKNFNYLKKYYYFFTLLCMVLAAGKEWHHYPTKKNYDYKKTVTIDSDGDGVSDDIDLDDDNDGILDISEECYGFRAQETSGIWMGNTSSNITVDYSGASTQTIVENFSSPQMNYWINQNGGGKRHAKNGTVNFTFTFSTPIPAKEIAFFMEDLDPTIGGALGANAVYTFRINGGLIPINDFQIVSAKFPAAYNPITATYTSPGGGSANDNQTFLIRGTTNTLISSITLTGISIDNNDLVAYTLLAYKTCDTDGDGTPDTLDLDSDNDGCTDAAEGDENVLYTQISNGRITGAVDSNGVPVLVNSGGAADIGGDEGQGIGNSTINSIIDCKCNLAAVTSGTSINTQMGITSLGRAGAENGNWPMTRNGGWMALESKTKGFVINRLTSSQIATISSSQLKQGMMVYNTTLDCLYINTDGTATGWKCFNSQGCPFNF